MRATNIGRALLQSRWVPKDRAPKGSIEVPTGSIEHSAIKDVPVDLQAVMVQGLRSQLGLGSATAKKRKTVLYISTVGEYEFLDPKAERAVGQQVFQALVMLRCRGMNTRSVNGSTRSNRSRSIPKLTCLF